MQIKKNQFFATSAWLQGAWASDVLFTIDANGSWSHIQPNASLADRSQAISLNGPVIPSLVNAHSHAFQRSIVGLTERKSSSTANASDDFWSWRDRMYSAALRISPEQLEHIATKLYRELLQAGYSQVCEFHYLHNAIDGQPYANSLEMSLALVRAARHTGIGLTLLPTLYMHSGFGVVGLREDQRRFNSSPDSIMKMIESLQNETKAIPNTNIGFAIHSLRAADKSAVLEMAAYAKKHTLPVHIHISEQMQEVEDCISHTGQRPIEWLCEHVALDANWNLVHATHTTQDELSAIQKSQASIVICPSTEANLGDGIFDYPNYAQIGGKWSIGSDSHVTRSWTEELRLLEYSQRLNLRKRNVAPQHGLNTSSAAVLFEAALNGASSATGKKLDGIKIGNRADFIVLDSESSALLGMPIEFTLDALIFSSPSDAFNNVYVAGNQVSSSNKANVRTLDTSISQKIDANFKNTMKQLWS